MKVVILPLTLASQSHKHIRPPLPEHILKRRKENTGTNVKRKKLSTRLAWLGNKNET